MKNLQMVLATAALLSLVPAAAAPAQQVRDYFNPQQQQQQQQQRQQQEGSQGRFDRVSDLIGKTIQTQQGEEVGTLTDVVLDPQQGIITYGVVSRGGVLGVGSKLYAVPWQLFAISPGQDNIRVNVNRERLENAPSFTRDNWPDMSSPNWRSRVDGYFGVQSSGMGRGSSGQRQSGSRLEQMFDPNRIETISGTIQNVQPGSGGGPLQATVRTDEGRTVLVLLAPSWFLEVHDIDLDQGDQVTVRGSQVSSGGRNALIATSVRTEDQRLRLRDRDGSPLWDAQQQGQRGQQEQRGQSERGSGSYSRQGSSAEDQESYERIRLNRADRQWTFMPVGSSDRDKNKSDRANSSGSGGSVGNGNLKGKTIENSQGQKLGTIDKVVVDANTGQNLYVVVRHGGMLGMGAKFTAVPWQAVTYDDNRNRAIVDVSKDRFKSAPTFGKDNQPDFFDTQWQQRTNQFYGVAGPAGQGGSPSDGRYGAGGSMQQRDQSIQPGDQAQPGMQQDQGSLNDQGRMRQQGGQLDTDSNMRNQAQPSAAPPADQD